MGRESGESIESNNQQSAVRDKVNHTRRMIGMKQGVDSRRTVTHIGRNDLCHEGLQINNEIVQKVQPTSTGSSFDTLVRSRGPRSRSRTLVNPGTENAIIDERLSVVLSNCVAY